MSIKVSGFLLATLKSALISGHTLELGKPVSRPVRVYSRPSGVLLATSHSNQQGFYKIYIPKDVAYTIISIDPNKKFNAVIQDNVVPK